MKSKLIILLLFILVFVCTGCGSNKSSDGSVNNFDIDHEVDYSNPKGTIVWSSGQLSGLGLRKRLIDGFEEKYPDVNVVLQEAPSTTNESQTYYATTIGGQSSTPDIYSGDSNWPAQFGNANMALDLSKIMPKSFWKRFPKGLVESATYQGGIYGAPLYDNIGVLYYRKDIVEKENIPVPETWEDLRKASADLQKNGDVKYGFVWQGASYEGLTTNFLEYLHAANGDVFDENGQVNINTPEAKHALTFMQSLISSGASPGAVTTFHEDEATNTFSSGSAAFLRNWVSYYGQLIDSESSEMSDAVGVTALPAFEDGDSNTTQSGWNIFINPHTENLEASLAFMDYLTSEEAQKMILGDQVIPTNIHVQQDPELLKKYEILDIYQDAKATPRPKTPNYNVLSEGMYMNVNKLLSSDKRVNDVLVQMEKQMRSADRSGL